MTSHYLMLSLWEIQLGWLEPHVGAQYRVFYCELYMDLALSDDSFFLPLWCSTDVIIHMCFPRTMQVYFYESSLFYHHHWVIGILGRNVYEFKIKRHNNSGCNFGKQHYETMVHVLVDCNSVGRFWCDVSILVKSNIGVDLPINARSMILGDLSKYTPFQLILFI